MELMSRGPPSCREASFQEGLLHLGDDGACATSLQTVDAFQPSKPLKADDDGNTWVSLNASNPAGTTSTNTVCYIALTQTYIQGVCLDLANLFALVLSCLGTS